MIRLEGLLAAGMATTLLAGNASSGVVIAQYTFAGSSPSSTDTDLLTDALDVQIGAFPGDTDVDPGPGFQETGAFARTEDTADPGTLGGTIVPLQTAIDDGDFFSFTIEHTGTDFSISQITFDYIVTASGTTTQFGAHLFSDVTGDTDAADELVSTTPGAIPVTTSSNGVTTSLTFLLSGETDLQNRTDDVTFSIFLRDNQSNNGQIHSLDNIVVTGDVPEPGSLALLGLGGACLIRRRRRG